MQENKTKIFLNFQHQERYKLQWNKGRLQVPHHLKSIRKYISGVYLETI